MTSLPSKPDLRRSMSAILTALPLSFQHSLSILLCRRLLADPVFTAAGSILLFAPIAGEPDLRLIADEALGVSKHICLPRTHWSSRSMAPVPITDWSRDLALSPQKIAEPRPELPALDPATLDLILVPGLAFDPLGNRLGRGAGFYDRFLSALPSSVRTLGVCFDEQLIPAVPADAHDVRVQGVLTPTSLFWI